MHVVQTFLALKKADEVQIQGRTARQGKQGTYALVLLQKDLDEKFKLGSLSNVAQCDRYATLERARSRTHQTACNEIETALAEATRIDQLTHQYFDAVLQVGAVPPPRSIAIGHLHSLYQELRGKEPMTASTYHVVFLTDKSGSMTHQSCRPSQLFCELGFPNPLGCALEACDSFVKMRHASGASDKISLIMFDDDVETALHGADIRPDLITGLLKTASWRNGGTVFSGAFEKASSLTRRETLPVLLMFLTDGQDTHGTADRLHRAINELQQNPNLTMKAIGFGSGFNKSHLREIAGQFGERGEYLAAIDGMQLVESFEAAAAELSHTGAGRR